MIIEFQGCVFQKIIFMLLIIFIFWLAQRIQWCIIIDALRICFFIIHVSREGGKKEEKKEGGKKLQHFGRGRPQINHGKF